MNIDIVKGDTKIEGTRFEELSDGAVFRILNGKAYYQKIKLRHEKLPDGSSVYKMVELRTGDAFPPTKSDCVELDGRVVITE